MMKRILCVILAVVIAVPNLYSLPPPKRLPSSKRNSLDLTKAIRPGLLDSDIVPSSSSSSTRSVSSNSLAPSYGAYSSQASSSDTSQKPETDREKAANGLAILTLIGLYLVALPFILIYKGCEAFSEWHDEIREDRRNEMGYLVKSESVWGNWRLTKIRESDNYTTIHKIDDSGPTITITCGGYTVKKTLSQDGTLSFSIFDFPEALQSFDGVFTFKVHHDAWNLDWIIEAPAFTDPDAIRDWNILVDEQYDYMTRSQALFRLKPALGQNAYHDLFEKFMERKINRKDMRKMPTKIVVTPL